MDDAEKLTRVILEGKSKLLEEAFDKGYRDMRGKAQAT